MRRRGILPIVLCIDVEPDGRAFDPDEPGGWGGFTTMVEALPPIRQRLAELTGAPAAFSWFLRMDPQIELTWGDAGWVTTQWRQELDALAAEGDEFGLHVHDWRWSEELGDWVADNDDPAWDAEVARVATSAFEHTLGYPPRIHRGGMHRVTPPMLEALAAGGVRVDLTAEPGLPPVQGREGELFIGHSPDWRPIPSDPFRTSPARFPAADASAVDGPLMMPLASAPTRRGGRAPLSIWSGNVGFAGRLALRTLRSAPPVLVFVARSNITLDSRWQLVLANLEHLARHRGARFVTASTAAQPFLEGS